MERNLRNIALLTEDQLATYSVLNSLYSRGQEARKIPIDKIAVRENFNSRIDFGNIRDLADFLMAGGSIPPIDVDVLKEDGTAIITDGERRYRAHLLLTSEGVPGFDFMQCFINPRNLTEADRKCKQASKNNSKDFSPMELAELFKDLRDVHGLSNADIAKKTGHNVMHVSNQLRLAGITDEEKDLIREGLVSSTAVLDMLKANTPPSARLDAIKSAAEGSGEGGKKGRLKVTDVPLLENLDHVPLDPNTDTPVSLLKSAFIQITMINRLAGMNSKLSDVTFKLENDLRNLKKLLAIMGILGTGTTPEEENQDNKVIDPLFAEAALLFIKHEQATASLLQRKLKLGYNRAGRIMDQLEAKNIIGPFNGSSPRNILLADEESLQEFLCTLELNTSPIKSILDIDDDEDEHPF